MTASSLILAVSFLPFFEAKNTVANYILVPPAEGAGEVSAEKPNLETHSECPVCEGRGKLDLVEPDHGQYQGRLGTPNRKKTVKCTFCGGDGGMEAYIDPIGLRTQVAKDREKFEADHLSKGDIPVGCAFVPRDAYDSLEAKETAGDREDREKRREAKKQRKEKLKMIESSYGKPCKACNWTGIEPCEKCDGNGWVKCPNDDCKGGWSIVKTSTKSTKRSSGGGGLSGSWRSSGSRNVTRTSEKINVSICPECGGAGKVACPVCGGRKARPCEKCKGMGVKKDH